MRTARTPQSYGVTTVSTNTVCRLAVELQREAFDPSDQRR